MLKYFPNTFKMALDLIFTSSIYDHSNNKKLPKRIMILQILNYPPKWPKTLNFCQNDQISLNEFTCSRHDLVQVDEQSKGI